jgi:hypothetical protein
MKSARAVLFFLFPVFVMVSVQALPRVNTQRAKYQALAARVHGGDLNIDWQALRVAAELSNAAHGFDMRAAAKRSLAALQAGRYDDALLAAREMQAHNLADVEGHSLAASALTHLGRAAEAKQERAILDALTQSILRSGDGKSAKSAFFTVNSREEYIVLHQLLQVTPTGQRLEHGNGHNYDAIAGKNAAGRDVIFWFNADTNMQKELDRQDNNVSAMGDPTHEDPAEPEDTKNPN